MVDAPNSNRWKWVLPFVVLIVILVVFSMYQWVIPRTDLEVRTVYHEAPGGGGTGGGININILMTNKGNRDIEELTCFARVRDQEGEVVAFREVESLFMESRENVELKLHFVGSQYETYRISLDLDFSSVGRQYSRDLTYTTVEDTMNLVFVEKVP
ncbi:MAG: hypothetical protein ACMUIE_05690 [Thermoplasmatota archaeon]